MENLPDEVLINIIQHLPIADISSFMLTNKFIYNICEDQYVWFKLICRDFVIIKFVNDKRYKSTYQTLKIINNCLHSSGANVHDIDIWKFMCKKIFEGGRHNWISLVIKHVNHDFSYFITYFIKYPGKIDTMISRTTIRGKTLLHKAKTYDDTKSVLDLVVDKNSLCLARCADGLTALHLAKNEYQTELLLNSVDDPEEYCNMTTTDRRTALHLARTAEQSYTLCKYVSNIEKYLTICDNGRHTALHLAKNAQQTDMLLKLHPNIKKYCEKKDIYGRTALHLATTTEQTEILLTSQGKSHPNAEEYCMTTDSFGNTPIFYYTNMDQIRMLLSYVQNPYSYCLIQNIYSRTCQSVLSESDWEELRFMYFPE